MAIESPQGERLGWSLYSSESKIRVRLFSRADERPDAAHWKSQLARAIAARRRMGLFDPRGACRLPAGDADLVPGLVIDHHALV